MKIIPRAYTSDDDKQAMMRLAWECQAEALHVIDLPYRLSSWALDDPGNIGLWSDEEGKLAAWAVMQTPFWTVDAIIRPDVETELHPRVLEWVDKRANLLSGASYGHPCWFINVFEDQEQRRQALENAGYRDQSQAGEDAWSKVWMKRDGKSPLPAHQLPKGFALRSLGGVAEVEAYVSLHRAVFESKNMTVEWRKRTLQHPGYQPELDVVVTAPGNKLAAFCIGWLGRGLSGSLIGQIEPLGCHADYRIYALGRLALCETLRRLQRLGAECIYVETDNFRNTAFRLYESVGFEVEREVCVYRKDYNGAGG